MMKNLKQKIQLLRKSKSINAAEKLIYTWVSGGDLSFSDFQTLLKIKEDEINS